MGSLTEFPPTAGRVVDVEGREIGIFNISGRLYAYDNFCLHQGGPACAGRVLGKVECVLAADKSVLAHRFSSDEIHFVCPWHGWEYDVSNGECVADRSLRLRSYPVVHRGGDVFVVLDAD